MGPTAAYFVKRHISILYVMDKACPFPKRYVKSVRQAIISFNELFDTVSIVLNTILGIEI